jgi:hypothetical protein
MHPPTQLISTDNNRSILSWLLCEGPFLSVFVFGALFTTTGLGTHDKQTFVLVPITKDLDFLLCQQASQPIHSLNNERLLLDFPIGRCSNLSDRPLV